MKNKKLLSILMSIIMMTSVFSGCVKNKQVEPENNPTVSDGLLDDENEEKEVTITIGNREFQVSEKEVSYIVEKGDNIWSIGRDLHVSEEDIMKYNNLSSDLIHPGDKIVVPTSIYKDNDKKTGIKVSEENGDINWEVVAQLADFALITFADYSQDAYTYTAEEKEYLNKLKEEYNFSSYFRIADDQALDSNFDSNVKACEEKEIPYGVVVYGDINRNEFDQNIQTGKKDAKEVISHLEGYDIKYPVILEISKYDSDNLNSSMGEMYHYANEDEYKRKKELAEQYCIDFLQEIKENGYYPMISVPDEVYACSVSKNNDLKKFDTLIYKPWKNYDKYDDFDKINCNISKGEEVDFPGMKWMQSYCETYIDNTKVGIENIVNKKVAKDIRKKSDSNIIIPCVIGAIAVVALIIRFGPGIYVNVVDRAKKDDEKTAKAIIKRRKNKKK